MDWVGKDSRREKEEEKTILENTSEKEDFEKYICLIKKLLFYQLIILVWKF